MSIASAHDKDADRGLTINPIVDTLKPVVEPTRSELIRIDTGRGVKLSFSRSCMPCSAMPPRSDDQLLVVLRLAQRDPIQTRALQVGVEPAGEVVDRNVLVFRNVIDHVYADVFPICVIVAMRHRLDEPMLIAGDEAKRCCARAQRQTFRIFAHLLSKLRHDLFVPCSVTITFWLEEVE